MGFGCGVRDHIKPTNCWTAYFSTAQEFLKGSKVGQGYSAVGGRFFAVGPDPSGMDRVLLMANRPHSDGDATLPFREAAKQGDNALKQFVARHYKNAGWKTAEIMKGMMETTDFYANEIVQVKIPTLHRGRIVLAGDAGYAAGPTGGGTSLAIACVYLLAGEIGKHKGDIAAGLKGYEEQVRPLITEMQKIPPFVYTFTAPQTAWGIWLRNHIFAFIAWTKILEFAQRFFAGAFASTDKYKLPDYE